MKKIATHVCSCFFLLMAFGAVNASAQNAEANGEVFKPHGQLWGYAFGDFAYKANSDVVNGGGRGGSNQYTKVPANTNEFQLRRVYLGYNYEISKKFVAEFLLAAEDDFASGSLGQGNGDILVNNKFAPYLKLANIRWRNIWKNTDLVAGQLPTPAFAQGSALGAYAKNTQTSEEVWGYRSIERTITDIRRTPSFDMGIALQGWFDNKGCFGYDVMVGNGQSAKPENDAFKWLYADVYAKFFNKRLIVDLYQDYEKLHWTPAGDALPETKTVTGTTTTYTIPSPTNLHHDRNMSKIFVAWQDKKFTVGVEAYMNTLMGDVQVVGADHNVYYRTSKSFGISTFVKGRIYKDKLGFFARYDVYDPSRNLSEVTGSANVTSYSALTSQYEPTTKEQFITFGLDFTPIKNVHVMPNMWINTYESTLSSSQYALNPNGNGSKGTDVVYRLTFYYIYGK
ncbi:MAG: hypothetical protein H0X33_03285 [Taibaiella sp.]|nr:hypothetical protein [Taibaiella sp.]